MAIDRKLLADKLAKCREQFKVSLDELATSTGISSERLLTFEQRKAVPDGDEILILADFYKCDFRFFISNEKVTAFEQTEYLFRMLGDELSPSDRWAIQEVLYLAECEDHLRKELGRSSKSFRFVKNGNYFKAHGEQAAHELRRHLGYKSNVVPVNVYQDFRKIGIYIFRRKLENSNISGICIKHPHIGKCVLVNYSEDVYRQRFTVAHEAGHSILDDDKDVMVSYVSWNPKDLSEIRANTFASSYLLPREVLTKIPQPSSWNSSKAIDWAKKLRVSTEALANALASHKLIDRTVQKNIKSVKVPSMFKADPELPDNLSERAKLRKKALLEHGLSDHYVRLCLDAYSNNLISAARMAEMLLVNESDLFDIIKMFGEGIQHG